MLSALVAAGAVGAAPNRARAASVFEGEYSDPKHPGCKRQVDADGRVSGTDGTPGCEKGEAQKPWALQVPPPPPCRRASHPNCSPAMEK